MKPNTKQLAYLRRHATQTGTTFAYPATSAASCREIQRLQALPRTGAGDARRERRDI